MSADLNIPITKMNDKTITIPQESWLNVCSQLHEVGKDSRRLDYVLSRFDSAFKNREEIDIAMKKPNQDNAQTSFVI